MNEPLYNVFDLDSETDLRLIELELDNISSGGIRNRIKKELHTFKENCSSMSIHCNEYKYNNDYKVYDKPLLNITVMDKLYKNNNVYSFTINEYYPFTKPKVEINFVDYANFLTTSQLSSKVLCKIHGIDCLCCSSITCHSNWSPAYSINHIILEIRNYKRYKKHILYKIFADKIKHKYLNNDIDLDCWLF
jgi:ubiquitin-protein ligase